MASALARTQPTYALANMGGMRYAIVMGASDISHLLAELRFFGIRVVETKLFPSYEIRSMPWTPSRDTIILPIEEKSLTFTEWGVLERTLSSKPF